MPRYAITQEKLDELQDQIRQLTRLNEAKEDRIRDLERHKLRVSGSETADLISAIGRLEEEIRDLKNFNRQLIESKKNNVKKIEELESLLGEERKLREHSENLAKQVELQCAEESLIRELTAELCQLQKDEIEIENQRIAELQRKIKRLSRSSQENRGEISAGRRSRSPVEISGRKEDPEKDIRLRSVLGRLRGQLVDVYEQVNRDPPTALEDQRQKRKVETWLGEIGEVMEDLNDIRDIRKELNYLKREIEGRRRSSLMQK